MHAAYWNEPTLELMDSSSEEWYYGLDWFHDSYRMDVYAKNRTEGFDAYKTAEFYFEACEDTYET